MRRMIPPGALCTFLLLAGCASAHAGADVPKDITGTWLVEDVDNTGVIDNARLSVAFDAQGRVSGLSGCNQYSGTYTGDGTALKVGPLLSTRKYCSPALMQQEERMLKSLQAATALAWTADGAAMLSGPAPHRLRLRMESPPTRDGSGFGPGHLPITPIPDSYRCGDEVFKVAFEEGVAYVTLPEDSMVTLPRVRPPGGSDQEAPRVFSNGNLTVIQEIEGGRAVRFARGRMVPLLCERL